MKIFIADEENVAKGLKDALDKIFQKEKDLECEVLDITQKLKENIKQKITSEDLLIIEAEIKLDEEDRHYDAKGFELAKQIEQEEKCHIIITTIEEPKRFVYKRLNDGSKLQDAVILQKPFTIEELKKFIQMFKDNREFISNTPVIYQFIKEIENQKFSKLPWTIAIIDDEIDSKEPKYCIDKKLEDIFKDLQSASREKFRFKELKRFGKKQAALIVNQKSDRSPKRELEELYDKLLDKDIDLYLVDICFCSHKFVQSNPEAKWGFDIIKFLRRRRKDAIIVALTELHEDPNIIHSIESGANYFVWKEKLHSLLPIMVKLFSTYQEILSEGKEQCWRCEVEEMMQGETWDTVEKPEKEMLLRKLGDLADYDKINIVKALTKGLSASDVLYILPEKKDEDYMFKVIKVGNKFELMDEKEKYKELVEDYLDCYVARIKEEVVARGDKAIIIYTAVGTFKRYLQEDGYPRSLKELIKETLKEEKVRVTHITRVLQAVFEKLLNEIHRQAKVQKDKILLEYYCEILPPHVKAVYEDRLSNEGKPVDKENIAIGEISEVKPKLQGDRQGKKYEIKVLDKENFFRYDIEGQGEIQNLARDPRARKGKLITLAYRSPELMKEIMNKKVSSALKKVFSQDLGNQDPFEWMKRILPVEDLKNPIDILTSLLKKKMDLTISRIHGDFNLDNILLTEEGRTLNLWLIDFAKVRYGHSFFDYVKLEVELKTRLMADILSDLCGKIRDELLETEHSNIHKILVKTFYDFECRNPEPFSKMNEELMNCKELLSSYQKKFHGIYRIIEHIREEAIKNLDPERVKEYEYFVSLFLYTLATLKFPNLEDGKECACVALPKVMSFVSAIAICNKLKELNII